MMPIGTRHATHDTRILHAAWTLSVPTQCSAVCAVRAWRGRTVCKWPMSFLEKLKLNFYSDVGQLYKPSSLKVRLLCCKDSFPRASFQLCLFDVQSLYPLLVNVITTCLSVTHSSLLTANNLLLVLTASIRPPSAIPFLKNLFPFSGAFQSYASASTAYTTAPTTWGGRKHVNRSLLPGYVDIFRR